MSDTYSTSVQSSDASGFDGSMVEEALSKYTEVLGQDAPETRLLKSVWSLYHAYQNGQPYIGEGAGEIFMRMSQTGDWLAKEWKMFNSQYDNNFKCFAAAVYKSHHLLRLQALGPLERDTEAYEAWLRNRRGTDAKRGLDRVLRGLQLMYFREI